MRVHWAVACREASQPCWWRLSGCCCREETVANQLTSWRWVPHPAQSVSVMGLQCFTDSTVLLFSFVFCSPHRAIWTRRSQWWPIRVPMMTDWGVQEVILWGAMYNLSLGLTLGPANFLPLLWLWQNSDICCFSWSVSYIYTYGPYMVLAPNCAYLHTVCGNYPGVVPHLCPL